MRHGGSRITKMVHIDLLHRQHKFGLLRSKKADETPMEIYGQVELMATMRPIYQDISITMIKNAIRSSR